MYETGETQTIEMKIASIVFEVLDQRKMILSYQMGASGGSVG